MAQLRHAHEAFDQLNTRLAAITFGEEDWVRGWLEDTQWPYPLLLDPERQLYRAYGLPSSVVRTWSPRTMAYYRHKKMQGEKLHDIQGNPNQLGGDFIIDSGGVVRLGYVSHDPVDRPSVEVLLDVLRRLS